MSLPSTVVFEGIELAVVDRDGRAWMTQTDLARALYGLKGGLQNEVPLSVPVKRIRQLFDRHRDEFTDEMTALLTIETAGGPQQVRIYSARGAWLIAMFAKTEAAKRFRVWVLDVLEGKISRHPRLDAGAIRELKARTAAMNAARGTLGEIRRTCGGPAARKAVPQIMGTIGVILTDDDVRPEQGELDIEEPPTDDGEEDEAA